MLHLSQKAAAKAATTSFTSKTHTLMSIGRIYLSTLRFPQRHGRSLSGEFGPPDGAKVA